MTPALSDRIRSHVIEHLESLASFEGDRLSIVAGDVVESMGLVNLTPAVCSALRSRKFQQELGLRLLSPIKRKDGKRVRFVYERAAVEGDSQVVPRVSSRSSRPSTPTPARPRGNGSSGDLKALPRADLCLVSCVKEKMSGAAPAKALYTSPWFRKARRLVEAKGWPWFILSAEHGLLPPERVIECYEQSISSMSAAERKEWTERVWLALVAHLDEVRSIVIFAGQNYRRYLVPKLLAHEIEVHVPMERLGIGSQGQWLSRQLARLDEGKRA